MASLRAGDDADNAELGALVKRGLKWSFAGTSAVRMGTFASGLVMARLLAPRDFGIYTVGAVALMLTASINDIGIEPTLVRWQGDLDAVAPTAMTIVMASSVALFAGFWFAASAFAHLLHAPGGANLVRLMSVGLIISGAFTVNSALTTRTFRQHVRTTAEVAGLVITVGLSIVLAQAGLGAYSLAWGHIAGNVAVGAVLFVGSPVHCRPGFRLPAARALLKAGLPLAGAGLLAVAILNVDYLVVGSVLGAVPLGLYLLAWNLSSWPISLFSGAVNRVSVAGFAKLAHDPDQSNRAFARSLGAVVAATIPFCTLLAVLAQPAVRVAYGHKWAAAANPLHFLAAVAAIRVSTLLATDVLVAGGWGRRTFLLQAVWLAALAPALAVGAHLGGIVGVGGGHLVVASCVAAPAYLLALRRQGFSVGALGRAVARPLVGSLCLAAVAFGALSLPGPDLAHLVVGGIAGLAVYFAVIRPLWAPLLVAHRLRAQVAA